MLTCVSSKFSNRLCEWQADTFAKIFPGSNNAKKKITLGWIKVMQFGTHGITPHFKSLLKLYIKNSDMIAFSFNEGLSGIMQTCIMGIIIQKWDCAEKCMRVCYWSSSFFGHAYWSTQTLDWGWQGFQS